MTSRRATGTCLALCMALCIIAAAGCRPGGTVVPNLAPHVELTGGPLPGGNEFYSVEFLWNAWDDDGTVDHFLYAIDDPDSVWATTREHKAQLLFQTPILADDQTYTGWHTFYLKAVDNEGAASAVIDRTFNARTVTPRTFPVRPTKLVQGAGINSPLTGGTAIRLEWDGEDPDGVEHAKPVAYQIVRVPVDANIAGQWTTARDLCLGPTADVTTVGGDTTAYTFSGLTTNGVNTNWLVWVRAVDEAGAVEQWPSRVNTWPGYFFFYFAQTRLAGPTLTVTSSLFGEMGVQGYGTQSLDFVFDRPIALSWQADASEYGADVDGFRWGVDVTDVENANDPGWATGWNRNLTGFTGLVFRDRLTPAHTIIVQARDTNGGVTTALVTIELVVFEFDRDVLFVDDELETSGSGLLPTGPEHLAFMRDALTRALETLGRPATIDVYDAFPDPTQFNPGRPPTLSDLTRYRVIVWDAGRPPGNTTLYTLTAVSPTRRPTGTNPLAFYLDAGGSLIVSGFGPARTSVLSIPSTATSIGPAQGLGPGVRNFAYDYWHLPTLVRFDWTRPTVNGLLATEPTASAAARGYGRLEFDAARWYRYATTGWTNTEALGGEPSAVGPGDDAEQLYTYVSAAGMGGSRGSLLHGLPDAQIYRHAPNGPDEDWQFQVAYVGFPLYLMRADQVTATLTGLLGEMLGDRKWSSGARVARGDGAATAER